MDTFLRSGALALFSPYRRDGDGISSHPRNDTLADADEAQSPQRSFPRHTSSLVFSFSVTLFFRTGGNAGPLDRHSKEDEHGSPGIFSLVARFASLHAVRVREVFPPRKGYDYPDYKGDWGSRRFLTLPFPNTFPSPPKKDPFSYI